MSRAAILPLLFAVATAMTTAALAHSKPEGNVPADGATVAVVPEIAMRFDDSMQIVTIELTRDGAAVDLERETGLEPVTAFRAVPAAPLRPGDYRVEWRGMAADGHLMQGGFGFTVSE